MFGEEEREGERERREGEMDLRGGLDHSLVHWVEFIS